MSGFTFQRLVAFITRLFLETALPPPRDEDLKKDWWLVLSKHSSRADTHLHKTASDYFPIQAGTMADVLKPSPHNEMNSSERKETYKSELSAAAWLEAWRLIRHAGVAKLFFLLCCASSVLYIRLTVMGHVPVPLHPPAALPNHSLSHCLPLLPLLSPSLSHCLPL